MTTAERTEAMLICAKERGDVPCSECSAYVSCKGREDILDAFKNFFNAIEDLIEKLRNLASIFSDMLNISPISDITYEKQKHGKTPYIFRRHSCGKRSVKLYKLITALFRPS